MLCDLDASGDASRGFATVFFIIVFVLGGALFRGCVMEYCICFGRVWRVDLVDVVSAFWFGLYQEGRFNQAVRELG